MCMKHECTRYLKLDEIRKSLELRTPRVTMTWPEGRQVEAPLERAKRLP